MLNKALFNLDFSLENAVYANKSYHELDDEEKLLLTCNYFINKPNQCEPHELFDDNMDELGLMWASYFTANPDRQEEIMEDIIKLMNKSIIDAGEFYINQEIEIKEEVLGLSMDDFERQTDYGVNDNMF